MRTFKILGWASPSEVRALRAKVSDLESRNENLRSGQTFLTSRVKELEESARRSPGTIHQLQAENRNLRESCEYHKNRYNTAYTALVETRAGHKDIRQDLDEMQDRCNLMEQKRNKAVAVATLVANLIEQLEPLVIELKAEVAPFLPCPPPEDTDNVRRTA